MLYNIKKRQNIKKGQEREARITPYYIYTRARREGKNNISYTICLFESITRHNYEVSAIFLRHFAQLRRKFTTFARDF